MHKGRPYELAQEARVYCAQIPYGLWWPKRFFCGVSAWEGPYSGQITTRTTLIEYFDLDRDAGTFEYRGVFPSTGGKIVEGVLTGTLQGARTEIDTTLNIEVDGIPQIVSPVVPGWFSKWNAAQFALGFPSPIVGYQVRWLTSFVVTAQPY